MKCFLIIYMILLSLNEGYAQNCKGSFIDAIEHTYNKSKKKFDRISEKSIIKSNKSKSIFFDDYKIMNIPVIVGEERKGVKINKENFFCHLNVKRMEFDESLISKDSTLLGIVRECPGTDCRYELDDTSPRFNIFMRPLASKLSSIKPDIIFSIYHITNSYWYLKDGELKVLSYENENGYIINIKICDAEEYIHSLTEEQISSFLHFEKTRVISY